MSIVIVGGHDRMVRQYLNICKKFKCNAKVFTQMPSHFKSKIGKADLLVLFTSTVSHKMVTGATQEAKKGNISIVHSQCSSSCALTKILEDRCY